MTPDPDNNPAFDPSIQSEDIAFRSGEMVACEACTRANPPNRLHCLYCGGALDIGTDAETAIRPNFRRLESWERGFNVIVQRAATTDASQIAKLLSWETAAAESILDAGTPLPVARVESERDAAFLQARLAELGVSSQIVSDADLAVDRPPVRVSRLDIGSANLALTDFNTGKLFEMSRDDLVLIVTGSIMQGRVDTLEKKRRRGKATKVITETATSSDESVLDLYSRHDATGFRIHLTGFDFSCLGERKGMLAAANLDALADMIIDLCKNAKPVDDYDSVREVLGSVWELESRKDSQGLMRIGVGKHEFGSVASTSNLAQFTKFSRLQWHVL